MAKVSLGRWLVRSGWIWNMAGEEVEEIEWEGIRNAWVALCRGHFRSWVSCESVEGVWE